MTPPSKSASDEPKGYTAALTELEKILSILDGNSVDVDALAMQVQRASFLITWCRGRIDAAQLQVDKVVAGLGDDE